MNWGIRFGLVLFTNTMFTSQSSNDFPSASNLTCYGHSCQEYVCTWVPGNATVEYVARWRDERDWGFWHDCRNKGTNACYFYGEITKQRQVTVQPKNYKGTDKSIVKTWLNFDYIIPLPPRNLTVTAGDKPEQLAAKWTDSPGYILNNQLYFRLRHRQRGSKEWTITLDIEGHVHIIDGLDPFTLYEIQIQARYFANENVYGDWSSPVYVKTKEGAPSGTVATLSVSEFSQDKEYRDVLISWMELPKQHRQGILLGYKIKLVCCVESSTEQFHVAANETKLRLHGLKKNVNYTAYITAYNSIGATEPSLVHIPIYDEKAQTENWYTYVIILVCVITVLLVSRVFWLQIRKFKTPLEPFPEPHFFKLEDNQPTFKPVCEKETFDELRSKPLHNESMVLLDTKYVAHQQQGAKDSKEISTYTVVKEL